MIRFEKLSATEKAYPFVDAVVAGDYKNGIFGTIGSGVFTAGTGFMAIMQVEKGDDFNSSDFVVAKGEHARIVDFDKADGQIVNITKALLSGTYKLNDKLVADSTGKLVVSASPSGSYLQVSEVTTYGVRAAVVVAKAAAADTK